MPDNVNIYTFSIELISASEVNDSTLSSIYPVIPINITPKITKKGNNNHILHA